MRNLRPSSHCKQVEQPPNTGIKVQFWQHPLCRLSLLTQNEVNCWKRSRKGVTESWLVLPEDTVRSNRAQTMSCLSLCVSCLELCKGRMFSPYSWKENYANYFQSGCSDGSRFREISPSVRGKSESLLLVEDVDKLMRRVVLKKGFEGQEGHKWARNVSRRAQHAQTWMSLGYILGHHKKKKNLTIIRKTFSRISALHE